MACGNYKHLCTCSFAVKCIHVCNTQKSRRHSFRHPGIAKYQHHCLMLLLRKMAIMTELWLWSKWVYAVLLLLLLLLHFKGKQNNWNDDTVTYKLDGCKSDIASFQYLLSAFHTRLLLTIFNVYKLFVHCVSKKQDTKLLPITSPNVNRFSKFFHGQTHW